MYRGRISIVLYVTVITATLYVYTTSPLAVAQQAYQVSISNKGYIPNPLFIRLGSTVTWTNDDTNRHTVTSLTGNFDSLELNKGEVFSFVFNTPGDYQYLDKDSNFRGSITVY